EYENIVGYGEASMPPYLGESHQSVIAFLSKAEKILSQIKTPVDLENILAEIDAIEKGNTSAKASIDIALHDLVGKMENVPCHKMFGLNKEASKYSTYTIGMDE